jgi:hypothetical protein
VGAAEVAFADVLEDPVGTVEALRAGTALVPHPRDGEPAADPA